MKNFLRRLVRTRTGARAEHLRFTVYTRQECCLCDKALDLLRDRQRRHAFAIDVRDVDTDPALIEQHGSWVPVVAVDGKVRFRRVVSPELLDRLLVAEACAARSRREEG